MTHYDTLLLKLCFFMFFLCADGFCCWPSAPVLSDTWPKKAIMSCTSALDAHRHTHKKKHHINTQQRNLTRMTRMLNTAIVYHSVLHSIRTFKKSHCEAGDLPQFGPSCCRGSCGLWTTLEAGLNQQLRIDMNRN